MLCWLLDVSEVAQPGSFSFSPIAGLLMANMEGGGKVRLWVLGDSTYGLLRPLPHYLHLAAYCQSDKGGHLSHPSALFSIFGTNISRAEKSLLVN